jgi:uncharacterized membrane protein
MTRRKRKQTKQQITRQQEALTPLSERLPGTASPEKRIEQLLSQTSHTHFSGPIPHPEIFKLYGEIVPDAPERILTVFEQDSRSARELPVMAIEAQKEDNRRAHWMAWSLVIASFCLSFIFAYMDKDYLAGITLGTTLVAIVTGFLQSNKKPEN